MSPVWASTDAGFGSIPETGRSSLRCVISPRLERRAITTVTPNTGPGQTRRSGSTWAVRTATTTLTASGGARDAASGQRKTSRRRPGRRTGRIRCRRTRERGGRVPGFSTGVQKDILVSSRPFRVFRRRGAAAARRPGRSARPRIRRAPRIRPTGPADARRTASRPPRWSRRRWTAGRARTPGCSAEGRP